MYIPGLEKQLRTEDPTVGYKYIPGALIRYNSGTKEYRERRINTEGFPTSEFQPPEPGIRIAFFGDSYTEARQVHLNQTYYNEIKRLSEGAISQTYGFGVSGYSTWQSYLTYSNYVEEFDPSMVVYQFCENDFTDNLYELNSVKRPYPNIESGKIVEHPFEPPVLSNTWTSRLYSYFSPKSVVLTSVYRLYRKFIKARNQKNESGPKKQANGLIIKQSLSEETKTRAVLIMRAILREWSDNVKAKGKQFAILIVPRSSGPSWREEILAICKEEELNCIDPQARFLEEQRNGKRIHADHFTPYGHKVFADVFFKWFKNNYS